jgi:hypothetical protein
MRKQARLIRRGTLCGESFFRPHSLCSSPGALCSGGGCVSRLDHKVRQGLDHKGEGEVFSRFPPILAILVWRRMRKQARP